MYHKRIKSVIFIFRNGTHLKFKIQINSMTGNSIYTLTFESQINVLNKQPPKVPNKLCLKKFFKNNKFKKISFHVLGYLLFLHYPWLI